MKKKTENLTTYIRSIALFILMFFASNTKATNYYWVGGGGNWTDYANHWATTPGGTTFHTQTPTANDDVTIDGAVWTGPINIGNQTLGPFTCKNLTIIATTNAVGLLVDTLKIYGSFNSTGNAGITGVILFGGSGSISGDLKDVFTVFSTVIFNAPGGTYNVNNDMGFRSLFIGAGTINYNADSLIARGSPLEFILDSDLYSTGNSANVNLGHTVIKALNMNIITAGPGGSLIADSSILNIMPGGLVECKVSSVNFNVIDGAESFTGYAQSSFKYLRTLRFYGAGAIIDSMACSRIYSVDDSASLGKNYIKFLAPDSNAAIVNGNILAFYGNQTIVERFAPGIRPETIDINPGDTLFINQNLNIGENLVGGSKINIGSFSSGLTSYISCASTLPSCIKNAVLKNIHILGSSTFYADTSCTDIGGNSGLTWAPCSPVASGLDYYWVGGTGNWSDFANHWATNSGGATFHIQPPTGNDNVIFDINSFLTAGDTVTAIPGIFCRNMDWRMAANTPTFICPNKMTLSGSLWLNSAMNYTAGSQHEFNCNGVKNQLQTAGHPLTYIWIIGGDTLELLDTLSMTDQLTAVSNHIINVSNGVLRLNGNHLNAGALTVAGPTSNVDMSGGSIDVAYPMFRATNGVNSKIRYLIRPFLGPLYILGPCDEIEMIDSTYGIFTSHSFDMGNTFAKSVTYNGFLLQNFKDAFQFKDFNAGSFLFGAFPLVISNANASHAIIGGATRIINSTFDTLNISSIADTLFIDSVVVNKFYQTQITSPFVLAGTFSPGFINMSTGQLCLQNTTIQNINAVGGATFNADSTCIDGGGNTGWNFLSNSCLSLLNDVWPGDANYDLTADNNDVLNIGIAYGNTGPVRTAASLTWVGQPATDWGTGFINGVDHKHADTNGDGIVNDNDTTAISLNYGLTHPARYGDNLTNNIADPPLYLTALSDTLAEGDSVEVTISLGSAALPVTDLYGLAFTINFDNTVLDTNYIAFDFTGCWIGNPGINLLTYTYQRSTDGAIDVAITRTDHLDTSGFGYIGKFGSVIVDNVGARLASGSFMDMAFTISNVTAIHFDETLLPLAASGDSIVIDTAGITGTIKPQELTNKVMIYPNPASDKLIIRSGNLEVISLEIINSMGNRILEQNDVIDVHTINTTVLSQGLYIIKLQTEAGVVVKKFQVVKRKN